MVLKQIPIIIFSFIQVSLYAQNIENINQYLHKIEELIDLQNSKGQEKLSIQTLINNRLTSSGEKRITACFKLYTYYIYKSTEKAKQFNDEAYELSKNINFESGILKATSNQAYINFIQGEFDTTEKLISKIESQNQLKNFIEILADYESLKSYVFTERGNYDMALENALKLLEIGENSNNAYVLMKAYSAISHVYLRLGNYEKSLKNCLLSLDYVLELEKIQYLFPKIDEIARMTHKINGSLKASEIYDFYLRMEKKTPGPGGYIQSVVYMNIADILMEENKFSKAELFLNKALELISFNNYRFRKPRVFVLKAELDMKMQDTITAISNFRKGFRAAKEIDAYDVIKSASKSLSSLLKATEDTIQASYFSNIYTTVSDSLFSIELEQRIKILEATRKINEISKQKELLVLRSESQEERYKYTILILALTFISGLIATFSYYKIKKKNKFLFDRTKELAVEKLNQKKFVIQQNNSNPKILKNNSKAKECYLDEDVKDIILTKLKRLEDELFFLDPKCRLHDLAEDLQTNQKYLSQVINHEKETNFNNYINGLRITYLLNRFLEDEDFRNSKLSYIAVSSGFNNLNTFHTAFKKHLGILPSSFIKQLNAEEKYNDKVTIQSKYS
ncbi:helix-turn-helix domain-containing protein [Maribacter confluentis]|uniref:Helix-turn-helix domain-containing protein n=1 Tax=Maribacter confluentis TaxID=1656093 RepID=A0ABT8RPP8_9FLAO|nr:helix-turn-helix domain-containing protein [Maribacter confluentis]MDO1512868.1 helix-turn-helix domain-containing protein [Maribacter confluentis]